MTSKKMLLIEDNPGDVLLFKKAVKRAGLEVDIEVAGDGDSAMSFMESLRGSDKVPSLVFLDLNLPRVNGLEVLKKLKRDSEFKHIPVVIFTSSDREGDIRSAYDEHANAYLTKPNSLPALVAKTRVSLSFWLNNVKTPTIEARSLG